MIVASFHAPREDRWGCDYDALLQLLDASCRRLGLRHLVITDSPRTIAGGRPLEHFQCRLPENLMLAILDGQRQFLAQTSDPVLFVGADCLLTRDPSPMLAGDITITLGPFSDCEMNTGAIWCASPARCESVWRAALADCRGDWGDDQTSLYAAIGAAEARAELAVIRVRCEQHNWAPDGAEDPAGMPTVAHFRGPRKAFMAQWGRGFLGV